MAFMFTSNLEHQKKYTRNLYTKKVLHLTAFTPDTFDSPLDTWNLLTTETF